MRALHVRIHIACCLLRFAVWLVQAPVCISRILIDCLLGTCCTGVLPDHAVLIQVCVLVETLFVVSLFARQDLDYGARSVVSASSCV